MRKCNYCLMFALMLMSVFSFHSCKEDIDLADVDPQLQLGMGLALPFGGLETNLDDFLGKSGFNADLLTYSPEDSMLVLHYDTVFKWNFHLIDLSTYSTWMEFDFGLLDGISDNDVVIPDFEIPLPNERIVLEYPCELSLNNINSDESYESIDSLHLTNLVLSSLIDVVDVNLTWQEIDSMVVVFDDATFRMDNGKNECVLPLEDNLVGFGEKMFVNLGNVTFVPQINTNDGNKDKLNFTIRIVLFPEEGRTIKETSSFKCGVGVDMLDFDVVYGRFEPKKAYSQTHKDTLAKYLPLEKLRGMSLPFASPEVELFVRTNSVGIPTLLTIDSVYVQNSQGEHYQLSYEGETAKTYRMPYVETPYSQEMAESEHIRLDATPENGDFDQLFNIMPDYFGYGYRIRVDQDEYEAMLAAGHSPFIFNNANLEMSMGMELPMKFNPGMIVFYNDTLETNIGDSFRLDSLLNGLAVLDSLKAGEIYIRMVAENKIPFDIHAKIRLLDVNDKVVEIAGLYSGGENDSICFSKMTNNIPTKQPIDLNVSKEEIEKLGDVKQIVYDFYLGGNTDVAALYANSGIKLNLGLAGKVEAIINLGKENRK